ncbi:MAG: hypothetical protein U0359_30425 [Byssovorax sp.]
MKFPSSTLMGDHWDSGSTVTFSLGVPLPVGIVNLTLHDARISMDLGADHLSAKGGLIGGVLDTEEFAKVVQQLLGAQFGSCSGPIVDSVLNQIRQASDIMKDGSQNPAKTCDGISIGLGFTMQTIDFGAVGPETPPGDMPCP